MDLDKLFIDKVIQAGKLESAIDSGITADDLEGPSKQVYEFVVEYYRNPKYKGALPTAKILKRQFPAYKYEVNEESFEWVVDQLRERSDYNLMSHEMATIAKALKAGDVNLAKESFSLAGMKVSTRRSQTNLVSLTRNMDERKLRYLQRRDKVALYGVPTGFAWLDDLTLGIHVPDLILLLAKRGVGKTWAALIMAHSAQMSGIPVMFVSREMGAQQIERRYDALHAKLPYRAFRRGEIGHHLEQHYFQTLDKMKDLAPFYVPEFEGLCSPMTIEAKARELGVGLIVIDGVYMLADDLGVKTGWEKHLHIADGLKTALKRNGMRGIITNQLNKEEDPKYATLDNSAFGDAYGMFCDVGLKLVQDSDARINHEMLMQVLKAREEEVPHEPVRVPWDFDDMTFDTPAGVQEQANDDVQY